MPVCPPSLQSLVGKGHLMRMQEYKQKTREMATVLEAQRKSLKAMRDAVVAQRDDILNLVGAAQNEVRRTMGACSGWWTHLTCRAACHQP